MAAFGLPPERILNAPSWTKTDAYDITVQADREIASGDLQPLLRELLRERFNFASRSGTQEFPAHALTLARADGSLGPRLRRTPIDCRDTAAVAEARAEAASGRPICGGGVRGTTLAMSGMSLKRPSPCAVSTDRLPR